MGILSNITTRFERQGRLMGGMIDRLGVDAEKLGRDPLGVNLARAVRLCAFCQHGADCQSWQADNPDHADQAPAFCPNAEFWARQGA